MASCKLGKHLPTMSHLNPECGLRLSLLPVQQVEQPAFTKQGSLQWKVNAAKGSGR